MGAAQMLRQADAYLTADMRRITRVSRATIVNPMSARLALVSTREMPVLDAGEELLLPLLSEAEIAYWDDDATDWASYELVIIRSTWNYTERLDEFLAWAPRISHLTRVV